MRGRVGEWESGRVGEANDQPTIIITKPIIRNPHTTPPRLPRVARNAWQVELEAKWDAYTDRLQGQTHSMMEEALNAQRFQFEQALVETKQQVGPRGRWWGWW